MCMAGAPGLQMKARMNRQKMFLVIAVVDVKGEKKICFVVELALK